MTKDEVKDLFEKKISSHLHGNNYYLIDLMLDAFEDSVKELEPHKELTEPKTIAVAAVGN